MDGLKIYKISKNNYEATRDSKLFSFMWNPIKYKIYNFKKLGGFSDKYVQKGTLLKKPHIQMILQLQNKISDKKTNETMKHVKLYENFNKFDRVEDEAHHKEIYPKLKFDEITIPLEPLEPLSDVQRDFLYRNYPTHSFSNIDVQGRIILGGGHSRGGMYYITENDLNTFIEEEKAHMNENKDTESINEDIKPFGVVNVHIDGEGFIKKTSVKYIIKALNGLQGERHIFVDGKEINPHGRGIPRSGGGMG
jgi:hypothetical protein